MSEKVLTNTIHIDAAPETVINHLSTPESYIGLSPLIVSVSDVDRTRPGVVRYTAVERFKYLGFIKYDNVIKVDLFTDATSVHGEVKSPGGITMRYRFDAHPDGAGTRLEDKLDMTAPGFLIGYASSEARKVQLSRARILQERLKGTR